jgi:LysM repeat protein
LNTTSEEQHWAKRVRLLTQILIISGAINIGLIATFIYFAFKERPTSLAYELSRLEEGAQVKKEESLTNEKILRALSTESFSQLIALLSDKQLIEEGYTKRDLALACLVSFHHFDLERALASTPLQCRQLSFFNERGDEKLLITAFPGLVDYQYQAIIQFAKTEKWPFTARGLFYEIRRSGIDGDPSLLRTFYLTSEFHAMEMLFKRSNILLRREVLLELLLEADWNRIADFAKEQTLSKEPADERRREFLLNLLAQRSKLAAAFLIEHDAQAIFKKLDDSTVLILLDLVNQKSPELIDFLKGLITSPRSDSVLEKAKAKLVSLDGENALLALKPPEIPQEMPKVEEMSKPAAVKEVKKSEGRPRLPAFHTVKQGDNLWKIAQRYGIPVKRIKEFNYLDSDRLYPGQELMIPER